MPPQPASTHEALDDCDRALVDAMLCGDRIRAEHAMNSLYRRHANAVYRFASMIAASGDTAGDATQEAFVWFAREGAHKWDASRGTIAALLCGVARNHVLRMQTQEARFVLFEGDDALAAIVDNDAHHESMPDGFAALDAREREAAMHEAIAGLPHEFREVIVLVELEEFSYDAAASIIGCPIGTVRSRLSRAKARLKENLSELFADEIGKAA
jgi:RNA polymerase sigma-70 factor, ECF subfamily